MFNSSADLTLSFRTNSNAKKIFVSESVTLLLNMTNIYDISTLTLLDLYFLLHAPGVGGYSCSSPLGLNRVKTTKNNLVYELTDRISKSKIIFQYFKNILQQQFHQH